LPILVATENTDYPAAHQMICWNIPWSP